MVVGASGCTIGTDSTTAGGAGGVGGIAGAAGRDWLPGTIRRKKFVRGFREGGRAAGLPAAGDELGAWAVLGTT